VEELMRRRGIQVGHSLNMIAELPHYAYNPDVPKALRAAAFDAFFMHLRLLIDFLITKPRRDRPPVISRWDYVQGVHLDEPLRQRLQAASQFASVHVAHYNADRVQGPQSPVSLAPDRSELDAHRDDVFAAMAVIVERLKSDGSVHAADFDRWLQDAGQRATAKEP
jgi:hypothetical protein